MKTSVPSCSRACSRGAGLHELRQLEEFLAAKLESVHRSGRKSDSLFLRGLEELHEVLSLGLSSLRSGTEPVEPAGIPPRPTVSAADIQAEPELAEDEFLLDFSEEILCLQASREFSETFLPIGLRRRETRSCT